MNIVDIGSCQFNDSVTGELSYLVVRITDNKIGIGLSQETNGDIEVFLDAKRCELLIEWINKALSIVKSVG
jgi:hypothetical protein